MKLLCLKVRFIRLIHSRAEMGLLSADMGVDFDAMFISPAKVPAPRHPLATDSSDDDQPKPPPLKSSHKITRARHPENHPLATDSSEDDQPKPPPPKGRQQSTRAGHPENHQSAGDWSEDYLRSPPPLKGSRKSTRAGHSEIIRKQKSVDQLERSELADQSDDGKILKLLLKDSESIPLTQE